MNYGGLAVVARSGLNLSRVSLPFSPTTFECDCIRLSSSGSSCLLLHVSTSTHSLGGILDVNVTKSDEPPILFAGL